MKIKIKVSGIAVVAELYNTKTARAIYEILPTKGIANTWGDEVYFSIPINLKSENGKEEVETGDVAYWPPGKAFCIFFGKTPVSTNEKPKAASPVNVFGKIRNGLHTFKNVKDGETIVLETVN